VSELERGYARIRRRSKRLAKLPGGAKCAVCGETDWRCLREHHTAKKANDEGQIVALCLNCHAKITDNQLDWPEPLLERDRDAQQPAPNDLASAGILYGLTEILKAAADRLLQLSKET
jgi:hypothetical protein